MQVDEEEDDEGSSEELPQEDLPKKRGRPKGADKDKLLAQFEQTLLSRAKKSRE